MCYLDKQNFSTVIASTPLVSIDLVVVNSNDEVLLGKRVNKPAQGFLFVPGGRIQKNETMNETFQRLTLDELGVAFSIQHAELLGPLTHLYHDYVFGDDVNTHYVAIAYKLVVDLETLNLPLDSQHNQYQWLPVNVLLNSDDVHLHTKWYFQSS
ncbi:GDP-mannose mannosyl hydrolase [Vibrio cyclitrophicus]|uniref:GDP-mannose mannosyl hydrolase n=1 Tax=Vibrio cyclitrophicus TaxID=47951 RepID=UPI000492999A|nr:GDP-mannose mannosyl hydrolase [Vibrio cyclitrophicus]OCH48071.1 GDP-mannose mannosyl hydrolase [Vibrio cyclitrophicus]